MGSEVDEIIEKSSNQVEEELAEVLAAAAYKDVELATINAQMTELRRRAEKLRDEKTELVRRKHNLFREKESVLRLEQLAKEQKEIEKQFEELVREAEAIIAEAPWRETAFDWQIRGAVQLASAKTLSINGVTGSRGLLADVRGMGKTLSAIVWRKIVGSRKTLIVTRKSYAEEFIKELHLREPGLQVIPLIGPNPLQRKTVTSFLKNHDDFVLVANFEMWRREPETAVADLLQVGFDAVIIDEAHQLKTYTSGTTQGFKIVAMNVPHVLEMTGSPVQNRPQELFALLHCLYPHLFPRESDFIRDYCERARDENGQVLQNRWTWKYGGLERLMEKMSKFFVARTPEDVGHKIPPPAIHDYQLDFGGYSEQAEAYRSMATRALAQLSSGKVLPIPSQLALMTRLAQVAVWPAGIKFNIKDYETDEIIETVKFDVYESVVLDWAEDFIKELAEENRRVVVFSRFVEPLNELQRRLNSVFPVAVVTGETSDRDRRIAINDFDLKTAPDRPRYKALLATYQTIGESVNLNSARDLIQLDRFWKPSMDDQSIGRIDRINSVDQATVHRPFVTGTIYEFMIDLINQKRDLISAFKNENEFQNKFRESLEASIR